MDHQDRRAQATKVVKAKMGFYIHLIVYLLVNVGLIAINLSTSSERIWFVWPLLGWGLGVLLHAVLVFAFPKWDGLGEWIIAREMSKHSAQKP